MRYIISLVLALSIFISFSSPVGATATVSGETRMSTPIKSKWVIKTKFTKVQKEKLILAKNKLLTDIAKLKLDIATYSANISDIKAKIDARKKAGITDNADLEAKMKTLKKSVLQLKKNLAVLMENLAYVEKKLK